MIKKIFAGVFLAILFGLLVFGAVNRTLAKTGENEPLALSKALSEDREGENLSLNLQQNKNLSENKRLEKNLSQGGQGGQGEQGGQGGGQNLNDCDEGQSTDESGYRRGAQNPGNPAAENQGRGDNGVPQDGLGVGQADADAYEQATLSGTVLSIASDLLIVELSDGSALEIEGRNLSYITEQGFSISEGDALTLEGFYEDGTFKVSFIENNTSGETIRIREETGRPLWSGGRGGNLDH